jgi:UDP-glucose 4-epimerase
LKKKVLITGCNGFIGRYLIRFYKSRGDFVYGIHRKQEGNISCENVKFLRHDLEFEDMGDIYRAISPDVFIHCAGNAHVGVSIEYPEIDFQSNVGILYKTLSSITRANIKPKVIFLSSAAVYGNPKNLPITENTYCNPISPYGFHKKVCEDLCNYFRNSYGMNISIARIFSAYGDGLRKQILWDMYKKYLRNKCIELFGTGNETRDFIHINDVVQAVNLIVEKESPQFIYNIGNGEETSIRLLSEEFAKCLCVEKNNVKFNGEEKTGDPLNWRADITRIKELGYSKGVNLKDGIESYVKWVRKDG